MTETELQTIVQRAVDEERASLQKDIANSISGIMNMHFGAAPIDECYQAVLMAISRRIGKPVEVDHDING